MAWLCGFGVVFGIWTGISRHIFLGRDRWHETSAFEVWSTNVRGHLFADHSDFINSISGWEGSSELSLSRRH
jgi:hypothetical protein